ncbi:MAG: YciI family protein [Dehalococcoidia bacterium]
MTQYLLSVWSVEGQDNYATPEAMQAAFEAVDALNKEMQEAGIWVFGGGLMPADTASVIRVRGGGVISTDGPFAESKEQLGGFWIIEVADDASAAAWAEKATVACAQPVEVRPFQAE